MGLHGGGALSRLYDTDRIAVAAMDQNNAFTRVIVPELMRRWCAGPPVRTFKVWEKLPEWIRSEVSQGGWVYPLYGRLAMDLRTLFSSLWLLICFRWGAS